MVRFWKKTDSISLFLYTLYKYYLITPNAPQKKTEPFKWVRPY